MTQNANGIIIGVSSAMHEVDISIKEKFPHEREENVKQEKTKDEQIEMIK